MKERIDVECKNGLVLIKKPADKVALITLNNPPLNLVTLELSHELKETLFRLEQDNRVWVMVLTGSGEEALCVGSDVKGLPLVWDDMIRKKLQKENEVFNTIEFLDKPVIATMEGNVCGGGYEMTMTYDLRILSESGRIAQSEINLGVFPESGGIFRLPKLVGASKAMEMMFLGEFIDAEDCLRLGLVNRLIPASRTVSAAFDLVERIAHKPFEAVKLIKEGVRGISIVSPDKYSYKNLEFSRSVLKTEDCKGGVGVFPGKRSLQFR